MAVAVSPSFLTLVYGIARLDAADGGTQVCCETGDLCQMTVPLACCATLVWKL
ncbi:hypothetical protein [Streptomyces canus]|uniref:hypothetical protein n=1 Tax=Streptomyces canus TaxID=58343 RepID=UPI0003737E1C|nr:hypothetical protein [Streptomyces canus]